MYDVVALEKENVCNGVKSNALDRFERDKYLMERGNNTDQHKCIIHTYVKIDPNEVSYCVNEMQYKVFEVLRN
jgi:hypothetical protein